MGEPAKTYGSPAVTPAEKVFLMAALQGELPAVRIALAAGVNVNARTEHKFEWDVTALMLAAEAGHDEVVEALLAAGADTKAVTKGYEGDGGWTALMKAARRGHLEVVRRLLKQGVKPANRSGKPSLLEIAIERQDATLFALLLEHGADVNRRGGMKRTPLIVAAEAGQPTFVELLLQSGAEVDTQDELGRTALMVAAEQGQLAIAQRLVQAGAGLHFAQTHGLTGATALVLAAWRGNLELVDYLLEIGCNPNSVAGDSSALDLARAFSHGAVVRRLKAAGAQTAHELGVVVTAAGSNYRGILRPALGPRSDSAGFRQAVADFAALSGSEALPLLDGIQGGASFVIEGQRLPELVRQHQPAFLARGCFLFEALRERRAALLPTTDKAEVIAFMQTNGTNYDVGPGNIIEAMAQVEQGQGFELYGVSFDFLSGRFALPLKNARTLARQLYEICPDFVDQGPGSVALAAAALKKSGEFFLWWD